MKKLVLIFALMVGASSILAADAANDVLLNQRNGANDDNVQQNVSATANALFAFNNSLAPISTLTPTGLTSLGVNSVTAAASTPLTLTGGSTGASLVLGQGATAADVTITPKGTGITTSTADMRFGYNAANVGGLSFSKSATSPDGSPSVAFLRILGQSFNEATAGAAYFGWGNGGTTAIANTRNSSEGTISFLTTLSATNAVRMTLSNTGNLLIGTTTDAANLSGGLIINGSGTAAAASNTSTGALRVTGGVGVSGAIYAGGAATFAGAVTVSGSGGLTLSSGSANLVIQSGTGLFLDGGGNTYIVENAPDSIQLKTGGLTALTATATLTTFAGAVSLSTAGTTVSIKSGTNAAAGTVTLTGGAGTITSTAIDVNTVIVMTIKTKSGSFDHAPSVVVTAGSATIDGHNSDASTYNWIALKVN
jgi:hypothetical protein